ncbi:MAG: 50S ribosomal protein L6 [Planctomycetes bacterium]|nr:50S ribosomal protein L6 [Planctomycetota bacterium]
MSRIGKKPIDVPKGAEVKISGRNVEVEGPKGKLSLTMTGTISARLDDGHVLVERGSDERTERAKHGLYRALINNMVVGVTKGFEKTLIVMSSQGSAYRVVLKGRTLNLELGYSQPIDLTVPEGLEVEIPQQNVIVVRGIDKQMVGQFAATIRALRPPDVYRDRGIKYKDEWVRRIKIAKFGLQA